MKLNLFLFVGVLWFLLLPSCSDKDCKQKGIMVTNRFTESDKAFSNPLKGFRGGNSIFNCLEKVYVRWNEIESSETDDVQKIIEYSDKNFNPLYEKGIRVIPRIYLCWPYSEPAPGRIPVTQNGSTKYVESFFPSDMTFGDYSSTKFQQRVLKLVEKASQVWDNDKRVAYVEMGIIGYWGEQHSPSPSLEMQAFLAKTFQTYFKNKKVMIRNYNEFVDYDFGFYWDSFAHIQQENHLKGIIAKGNWRTSVNGGEVAYDWGDTYIQPGETPDKSLKEKVHRDYIIDCIRLTHTNHIGWISKFTIDDNDVYSGAEEVQKVLGYRFVIDEASFTPCIYDDGILELKLKIRNTGSSPLYETSPLQVSLMDKNSKEIVWSAISKENFANQWLPGDKWNVDTKQYDIPATVYTVTDEFNVNSVEDGEYLLVVSLLNKYTNKPSIRFAMDNYIRGGYTVIGKIGVNAKLDDNSVDNILFDDLSSDKLL